jgi:hypothetical protein
MDLAEFLLARIAEDEGRATDALGGRILAQLYVSKNATAGDIRFAERFDPARALAECEAKRRIVEQAQEHWDSAYGEPEIFIEEPWQGILRQLALPYANHPDYQPEWKP